MRPITRANPIEHSKTINRMPPACTPCRTVDPLTGGSAMTDVVSDAHIDARQPGLDGIVLGVVAGGGGDLWSVQHPGGAVAAYTFAEVTDRTPPDDLDGDA